MTYSRAFTRTAVLVLALVLLIQKHSATGRAAEAPSAATRPSRPMIRMAGGNFTKFATESSIKRYAGTHPYEVAFEATDSASALDKLLSGDVSLAALDSELIFDRCFAKHPDEIIFIPIGAEAVAVAYNLAGADQLTLDGPTLADICLGKIVRWSDPRIQQLNPNRRLPDRPIQLLYSGGASATTLTVTTYLSEVSPAWKSSIGADLSARFPSGHKVPGPAQVIEGLKQIDGAMAFINLNPLLHERMPFARMLNQRGEPILPSRDSANTVLNALAFTGRALRAVNSDAKGGYPLVGLFGCVARRHVGAGNDARSVQQLLHWLSHEGQTDLPEGCGRLNDRARSAINGVISTIQD